MRWLIDQGVLGTRGLLGTDTFGPDPGNDFKYRETSLTLHEHRFTLENLTNLGALPATGAWITWGGPRNAEGSGPVDRVRADPLARLTPRASRRRPRQRPFRLSR